MATHGALAVRPWSSEEKTKQDVPFLLARIINQKGGFRNVTEESLEEEIRNGEIGSDDEQSEANDEDEKPKPEQMQAARAEISRFAQQAFTESGQALDLISLLLTKHQPSAENSVSPYVRQAVPMSSLGAELVEPTLMDDTKQHDKQLTSTGWKLQTLNHAADSILKSATRLEDEMKKEAKYWQEVLTVKDKGWTVSRMPRDRQTLGVRFGFLEASPDFRNRSMAALQRQDDGGIKLVLGSDFPAKRILKARVVQDGITIAVSGSSIDSMDNDSIDTSILQARNRIFDAELFFELLRESRDLLFQGVRGSNSRISVPLDDRAKLLLELTDEGGSYHEATEKNNKYQSVPQLVLVLLRILLSYSHGQHYRQRSDRPTIIGDKERTRMTPSLLRTILSYVIHRKAVDETTANVRKLAELLQKASIYGEVLQARDKLDLGRLLKPKNAPTSHDVVNELLNSTTATTETILPVQISLGVDEDESSRTDPPSSYHIAILVRTRGTSSEFQLLLPGDSVDTRLQALFQETVFASPIEAVERAAEMIQGHLIRTIASRSRGLLRCGEGEDSRLFFGESNGSAHIIEVFLSSKELRVSLPKQSFINDGQNRTITRSWTIQTLVGGTRAAGLEDVIVKTALNHVAMSKQ